MGGRPGVSTAVWAAVAAGALVVVTGAVAARGCNERAVDRQAAEQQGVGGGEQGRVGPEEGVAGTDIRVVVGPPEAASDVQATVDPVASDEAKLKRSHSSGDAREARAAGPVREMVVGGNGRIKSRSSVGLTSAGDLAGPL